MTHPSLPDLFKSASGAYVTLKNPLNADMSVMRDTLLPSLCSAVGRNLAHRNEDLSLFEIRRVFFPSDLELPSEPLHLAAVRVGRRHPIGWAWDNAKTDFFDLKGALESFLANIGVLADSEFIKDDGFPGFTPGATARIQHKGQPLGVIGRLSREILAKFEIETDVYAFEIDLSVLTVHAESLYRFSAWPRYPKVNRDIAVIVAKDRPVGPMLEKLRSMNPNLIRSVDVFDVYEGPGIESGKKSVAFTLTLQSMSGTLTDHEADRVVGDALAALEKLFEARLRA